MKTIFKEVTAQTKKLSPIGLGYYHSITTITENKKLLDKLVTCKKVYCDQAK